METILIHPESAEQLKTIKAVLKALKVQFEPQSATLPSHVSKSIERSMKQYENGQTISLQKFTERQSHFLRLHLHTEARFKTGSVADWLLRRYPAQLFE